MLERFNKMSEIKKYHYPQNLYYAVNEWCDNTLPEEPSEDNLRGLEIALTYLTPSMRDILIYRFRDLLSNVDIGLKYDLSRSRINDLVNKGIKKLSARSSREIITRGLHGYIDYRIKTSVEAKEAIIEQKSYKKGYEEGYADALSNKKAKIREYHPASKIPIAEMDLPVRPYNCLIKAGYKTVYDVLQISATDIPKIKNLGRYARREIALALDRMGYINDIWKDWI